MYVSAWKPLAESGRKHPLCFAERSLTWTGSAECSGTGFWVRSMGAPASVLKSGRQQQQTRGELLCLAGLSKAMLVERKKKSQSFRNILASFCFFLEQLQGHYGSWPMLKKLVVVKWDIS